jgi:hypothetical protein
MVLGGIFGFASERLANAMTTRATDTDTPTQAVTE